MLEINLQRTMDARNWTKEFMRIFGNRKDDIDEALMLMWFSNAIMVGYDFGQKGEEKHLAELDVLEQI